MQPTHLVTHELNLKSYTSVDIFLHTNCMVVSEFALVLIRT